MGGWLDLCHEFFDLWGCYFQAYNLVLNALTSKITSNFGFSMRC